MIDRRDYDKADMKSRVDTFFACLLLLFGMGFLKPPPAAALEGNKYNVLFIISDDLTATALSCYGSKVCRTPNIDGLAARGTLFTRAYCQGTYCGPSRASFMSGYYPHAIKMLRYKSPRSAIGNRATWAQHFKVNIIFRSIRVFFSVF